MFSSSLYNISPTRWTPDIQLDEEPLILSYTRAENLSLTDTSILQSSISSKCLPKIANKSLHASASSISTFQPLLAKERLPLLPIFKKQTHLPMIIKGKIPEKAYTLAKRTTNKNVLQVKFVTISPFTKNSEPTKKIQKIQKFRKTSLSSSFLRP
jgi:hypothetical protein